VLLPSWVSDAVLLTLSEELSLPVLDVPGESLGSGAVDVFECLVLVLVPSWIVARFENEDLRTAAEPPRALIFASLVDPWLCLRGLEVLVPGLVWGDCEVGEDGAGALGAMSLPCNAAHERIEDNESFLCGWRTPSGLCFGSLASLDMATAGLKGQRRRKRRLQRWRNHEERFQF
jgi:hypothetical protein